MLFRQTLTLAAMAIFLLLGGCGDGDDSSTDSDQATDDDAADDDDDNDNDNNDDTSFAYPYCAVDEEEIDDLLAGMTLREKIGQLYYVGVTVLPWLDLPDARRKIQELHIGAVHEQMLYTLGFWPAWSVLNNNQLQALALDSEPGIPLLIGIDQEGGIPQMLCSITGGTDTPGNLGLGATFKPQATYRSYGIMAEEMHALGINVNLAPVLDVMTTSERISMYTRCFGEQTERVKVHGRQAVRALQEKRVVATIKHYPGQTAAPGDTHEVLAVSELDEQTIREVYLPPFTAAIAAGADMVMASHTRYAAWDDFYPATFSHALLTEVLREELGFEGVIITDDMNMHAITDHDWQECPDVLAIRAGADMIMDIFEDFSDNTATPCPTDLAGQIDEMVRAVRDGQLTESRIDESVRRILRLKIKYCLFAQPFRPVMDAEERVRNAASLAATRTLHEMAATLVRNEAGLWPLDPEAGARIHVVTTGPLVMEAYPEGGWPTISLTTLLTEMRRIKSDVTGEYFSTPLQPAMASRLIEHAAAAEAALLVIGTFNAQHDQTQAAMVRQLLALGRPTIVVAQAMPYDLLAFPEATTYLAIYSNRDAAVETAARALFGLAEPGGRLPVALPGLYPIGWSALNTR